MNKHNSPMIFRFLLASVAATTLTACAWVRLTNEGEGVRLAEVGQVNNCQRLGRATAQTRSRVAVVDRSSEAVQEEILILARNEAGRMGGNTIVPDSVITDGGQSFSVYSCP